MTGSPTATGNLLGGLRVGPGCAYPAVRGPPMGWGPCGSTDPGASREGLDP
jgi:hypothetical protein